MAINIFKQPKLVAMLTLAAFTVSVVLSLFCCLAMTSMPMSGMVMQSDCESMYDTNCPTIAQTHQTIWDSLQAVIFTTEAFSLVLALLLCLSAYIAKKLRYIANETLYTYFKSYLRTLSLGKMCDNFVSLFAEGILHSKRHIY